MVLLEFRTTTSGGKSRCQLRGIGHQKRADWLTLQSHANPVDRPEFLGEVKQVGGKVRL